MGSESDTTEQLSLILHFGSSVKSLRAMQARVRPLGWEVPLEKRMAMHSSILAWIIPWTKQPGRLQSVGYQSWTRLSNSHTHSSSSKRYCFRSPVDPPMFTKFSP